jgi:hypothetical protein
MEWEALFLDLSNFLVSIGEREAGATTSAAESILVRISSFQRVLYAIETTLRDHDDGDRELQGVLPTVSSLLSDLEQINTRWMFIESGMEANGSPKCPLRAQRVLPDSGRGRPKVVIEEEKIQFLRDLRFSWTQIAVIFGVCRRTLYTIRCEYGMIGDDVRFTQISDQELRYQVEAVKRDMPEIGYNMMRGVLRSRGIHVSIPRIQQCISDIDPINTALRWAAPTSRRRYGVPYPNYIWHIDGNHKLVRWRLVVHGGIDGFSRLIVYMQCSNNNRSNTVLQAFQGGVQMYGLPERIRSDRGGENVQVHNYYIIIVFVNLMYVYIQLCTLIIINF